MAAVVEEPARLIVPGRESGTVPASPASPMSLSRLSDLQHLSFSDFDMQELLNLPSVGEVPGRVYSVRP